MNSSFAAWAILLLVSMVILTPIGIGVAAGALAGSTGFGVGTGLAALGVTSGIASRWVGES